MKPTSNAMGAILLALICIALPQSGQTLELSESSLAIVTQDEVAPATGTLTLLGVSDELPPNAQTVAGVHSPGNTVLQVQVSLSTGAVYTIMGATEGRYPHYPGGYDFCCISASGYTTGSERIPGPDEFWPWMWNWYFDDPADPGLLAAGETADLWVSFTQLIPGDQIHFFAFGPSPEPCNSGSCQPFGTVTVLAGTAPLLSTPATLTLILLLCATALGLGHRFREPKRKKVS